MDHQPGLDLLSDLPLSIIHVILGFVPIRDAIRTSILSRQWRYTWTSLPHLVFEEHGESPDYESISKIEEERMENFITQALFHHKGPIHKCEIHVPFIWSNPDIDEWILCLSRNDVRELILEVDVHSSIYSCEKLTYLELRHCELNPPPSTFKGFLFLRCLFLQEVFLSRNGIESLVANSPLLERFDLLETIDSASGISKLRISSLNLKSLYIRGCYSELCVSAPLLAEMSVELTFDDFTAKPQQQKSSVCNYTNFMGGCTNLEKLRGSYFFTKYLSMGIESCHHTLVLHHLKCIALYEVNFEDIQTIVAVARLIVGAPNLQKLTISHAYYIVEDDASEAPHLSFRDFGCGPNFTFEKLRAVKMSHVRGLPLGMEFIKFLLERSPLLETMNLGSVFTAEEQELADELLGFCWASPNGKFSFR